MGSSEKFPEQAAPTKITYVDGRPTTITLRRCKLQVIRDGQLEEHTFDKDVITVGATGDNDLAVPDETVSRNHCRIFQEGDHYMIADLGSTNGTFVNRVRVREAYLKAECSVTLGKTEIRFGAVDEQMRIIPSEKQRFGEMIGRNAKMREIYAILEKIAPTDATVVIEGETGTGKEVVARTLHQQSRRREGPFMVFDCSAVPANLIESELFGHEKGSFTGAVNTRTGVFELAHSGSVFLDELGELQLDLQPKLLRVLEQREVKRIGGAKPSKVDVRVIAATNRDLEKEVREGRFREDLFYRLSVVRICLPPLRERKEDIPLLVKHFLRNSHFNRNREGDRRIHQISRQALDCLVEYNWPGNIRELLNVVERAVSFADTNTIEIQDLPEHVARPRILVPTGIESSDNSTAHELRAPDFDGTFKDAKEQWISSFEKEYIHHLLRKNDNNISHAAREAEIDRKYFRKLMKKYGISSTDAAPDEDDEV